MAKEYGWNNRGELRGVDLNLLIILNASITHRKLRAALKSMASAAA
jgi:hypothetical protein